MNKIQNEEWDSIIDEFLNAFKDQYSNRFYYMRVTESEKRSIHFVLSKKEEDSQKTRNNVYLKIQRQF